MSQETDKKVEEKKKKIKAWLSNPYNIALIVLIILAFSIRLYYFNITKFQPVWWDEAEYMIKANSLAFGTPETGWWGEGRPVLFPFLASLLFKAGLGEVFIRFFWVLLSTANILLIYLIGKKLVNERVGLFAALIMSFSYIDLFYTSRLLVDMPQMFFILLATLFFLKSGPLGHDGQSSKKAIFYVLPILFFGALIRFTVGVFIIVLFIFLLLIYGFKLFKKREWYISALFGIAVFIPYMIYSQIKYGNLFKAFLVFFASERGADFNPISVLMGYINYLPRYTTIILFLFFIFGLILAIFNLLIRYDLIRKGDKISINNLFILLWFVIPLLYFGLAVNHFEDRYLFMALPPMFFLIGMGLDKAREWLAKYNKNVAVVVIGLILAFSLYSMSSHSSIIIKSKITSYKDLKDTGLWIKENSSPDEAVATGGVPQITYYSQRASYSIEPNLEDQLKAIAGKNISYIVITNLEKTPAWILSYIQTNQTIFVPVHQSVTDYGGGQSYAIVMKVNSS